MVDNVRVRIPRPLFEVIEAEASRNFTDPVSFLGMAVRSYLDRGAPKPTTAKPENPTHAGLSPQARAALTKEETKKAKLDAERRAKAARLPEFDNDGYEVFRYGITQGWDLANPGEGYTSVFDTLPSGDIIYVRMPLTDYEHVHSVALPDHIPERKARDLSEDWESQL